MYKIFEEYLKSNHNQLEIFSKEKVKKKNTSRRKRYIVYHGSPYKFTKFDLDLTSDFHNGQEGSDYFFWFTDDKNAAKEFSYTYPKEYHSQYNYYYEIREKELENAKLKYPEMDTIIKEIKNNFPDYRLLYHLIGDLEEKGIAGLRTWFLNLNYEGVDSELVEYLKPIYLKAMEYYDTTTSKAQEKFDEQIKNLKDKYDNMPSYLYEVELDVDPKKVVEVEGEEVGIGWDRIWTIDAYFSEGADLVINKFADSGNGVLID